MAESFRRDVSAGAPLPAAFLQIPYAFAGGLIWGLVIAAGAGQALHATGWHSPEHVRIVLALYFAGAFVAFPVALFAGRLVAFGRSRQAAFCALFLSLACLTIGMTAAIYAFWYRVYYAQWHAEPFSKPWLLQLAFTVAGALYQFAVLGLRLYFPFGLAALFAAAFWLTRQPR